MNILYLHGSGDRLDIQKKAFLKQYGNVTDPEIDYKNNPNTFDYLANLFGRGTNGCIIGNGTGAVMAYHLARHLEIPALLFNPDLTNRSLKQYFPKTDKKFVKPIQFVLGSRDSSFLTLANLRFISEKHQEFEQCSIQVRSDLGQDVFYSVFEAEMKKFLIANPCLYDNFTPFRSSIISLDDSD